MRRTEKDKEREKIKRKKVAEIKLQKGCTDCGYKQNSYALEFDHKYNNGIPWTGKSRTVASMMCFKWEKIIEEINKCDVVCCNCHAIRTFKRRNLGI